MVAAARPLEIRLAIAVEVSLLLVIVMSAATDIARLAGAVSMLATLVLSLLVLATSALRVLMVRAVVLAGTALGAVVLLTVSPHTGPMAALLGRTPRPILASPFAIPVFPNTLAYLVVPAAAAAAAFAFAPASAPARRRWWIAVCAIASIVVIAAGSRGASIAVFVGILVAWWLSGRGARRALVALPALAGALVGIAYSDWRVSLEGRLELWGSLPALSWDPLGRYGGFAAQQLSTSGIVLDGDRPFNLHNTYLQTAWDLGLPGTIALLVLVALSIRASRRALRSGDERAALGVATLAALVAIAVIGLTESVVTTSFDYASVVLTIVQPVPFLVLVGPIGTDAPPER